MKNMTYKELALEGAEFQNPRVYVDSRGIRELADSIAVHGLMYPLQVWQTAVDGKPIHIVVDGGRRLRAIGRLIEEKRANGLDKKIPVFLIEAKSLNDAKIAAYTGNLQREDLTSYEIAKGMSELRDAGMSGKEIAERIGKSPAWVSKQLSAFSKCTDAAKKAWSQRKLPDDDVFSLAALPSDEQDARLAAILEAREEAKAATPGGGATKKRAKARQIAKNGVDAAARTLRPAPDKLERYVQLAAAASDKDRYVRGMHDAFLFALGQLGPGEFDGEWVTYATEQGFYKSDAPPTDEKGSEEPTEAPKKKAKSSKKTKSSKKAKAS